MHNEMNLDTTFYDRCIDTLDKAYHLLKNEEPENVEFDLYRSACIKEFEIILEQSGKLLRKVLKPYFDSTKTADQLTFKNIFRHAVLRSLISDENCERWLLYRDIRNHTAHDYGVNYAEETINILPEFIVDSRILSETIKNCNAD
jgi:nucleotidyltransferase substrate binding protein (TIGR01987 family)